jgi:hypothetical protein
MADIQPAIGGGIDGVLFRAEASRDNRFCGKRPSHSGRVVACSEVTHGSDPLERIVVYGEKYPDKEHLVAKGRVILGWRSALASVHPTPLIAGEPALS